MNIISIFHAYRFTHFEETDRTKTSHVEMGTFLNKVKILLFGITNPKPTNTIIPRFYKSYLLKSNKNIEIWTMDCGSIKCKGTVVLFHGYAGNKSLMLDKSNEFIKLGYNTIVVDFMGSGGSEGNQTTIGFDEAQNVKSVFDYLTSRKEDNIYLFGTSMGAVAILKAINDFGINPKGIILECPFGSMYETTCARFSKLKLPIFPMAGLLVFWGGALNGFWAFGHNPTDYAKQVKCPTLIMYGLQDKDVSKIEIDEIYVNLKGGKVLKTFENAGHENYLITNNTEWCISISDFFK